MSIKNEKVDFSSTAVIISINRVAKNKSKTNRYQIGSGGYNA